MKESIIRYEGICIAVSGGRAYPHRERVFRALNDLHKQRPVGLLIQGGSLGADAHARNWAATQQINCLTIPAMWRTFGPKAGPIRNGEIAEMRPDLWVFFPGGKGSEDARMWAVRQKIPMLHLEQSCAPK